MDTIKTKVALYIVILLGMVGVSTPSYGFSVENNDGVPIYYKFINDNKELEVTYKSYETPSYNYIRVVIPEEVTYENVTRKVTSIGEYAFKDCNVSEVVIPNTVTIIKDCAFLYCGQLSSITIPDQVDSIGKSAFQGCGGAYSITIPKNVRYIGDYAFLGCTNQMYTIDLPNVNYIGKNAFSDCVNLPKISIGNDDTSLENGTTIGEAAFMNCLNLLRVTLGNSVTSIGYDAFVDCKHLCVVVSHILEPSAVRYELHGGSIFDRDIHKRGSLYVPKGTIDKYKNANGIWTFTRIYEDETLGIVEIIQNGEDNGHIYDLNGRRHNQLQKGLNIIGGKKILK